MQYTEPESLQINNPRVTLTLTHKTRIIKFCNAFTLIPLNFQRHFLSLPLPHSRMEPFFLLLFSSIPITLFTFRYKCTFSFQSITVEQFWSLDYHCPVLMSAFALMLQMTEAYVLVI